MAQVLQMALQEGRTGVAREYPERKYCQEGKSGSPLKVAQKVLARVRLLLAVSGLRTFI